MPALALRLSIIALLACLLCSDCKAKAALPQGEVTFPTSGGVTLWGTSFGKGDLAVVLALFPAPDNPTFQALYQTIAEEGTTVFLFNLRGFYPSQGSPDVAMVPEDIRAAYRYLRAHGFRRLACVGASRGGTGCIETARDPGVECIATLSAPLQITSFKPGAGYFQGLRSHKLFIAGGREGSGADAAQALYDMSDQPKELVLYADTGAHATALFKDHGDDLQKRLAAFIRGCR